MEILKITVLTIVAIILIGFGFKALVFPGSCKNSGMRNGFFCSLISLPVCVALYTLLVGNTVPQFAALFLVCVSFIAAVVLLCKLTKKNDAQ